MLISEKTRVCLYNLQQAETELLKLRALLCAATQSDSTYRRLCAAYDRAKGQVDKEKQKLFSA